MTTLTVPPPSDEYLATLTRLGGTDLTASFDHTQSPELVADYVTAVLDVAALLDVARPNWFRVLDLNLLNMDSLERCVLGQLYASRTRPDGYANGYELGYDELIRPRFGSAGHLQLGVSSFAPRSVWVAEVARRRELADATGDTVVTATVEE